MNPQFINTLIFLVLVTLPLWLIARIISYRQTKPVSNFDLFKKEFAHGLLYLYFICLIAMTLLPNSRYTNSFPVSANVVPFVRGVTDLEDILKTHTLHSMMPHLVENILGNIILFIPVGFLFPICFRNFNAVKNVAAAGVIISVLIETLQWLSRFAGVYRSADIDDIILNTTGAIFGYLFYILLIAKKFDIRAINRNELTT